MRMRIAAVSLLLTACATTGTGTLEKNVVFDRYTPLSKSVEIARRTLPPLTFLAVEHKLLADKEKLSEQPIDLSKEKFSVYVPPGPPPAAGYGLLVFIPPWNDPTHPRVWRPPLDRRGIVFVAADNSGNEMSILDR